MRPLLGMAAGFCWTQVRIRSRKECPIETRAIEPSLRGHRLPPFPPNPLLIPCSDGIGDSRDRKGCL